MKSSPNNFYNIYQPKFAKALEILGKQKYMKALRSVRNKYNLEIGMEKYEEDIIKEILEKMRKLLWKKLKK